MFVLRTPRKVPHSTAHPRPPRATAGTQHLIIATKIDKKNDLPNIIHNITHTRTKKVVWRNKF